MHFAGIKIIACLCHGKSTLPRTLFGQFSRQFQHALHFRVFNWTKGVRVCSRFKKNGFVLLSFICKIAYDHSFKTITIVNKLPPVPYSGKRYRRNAQVRCNIMLWNALYNFRMVFHQILIAFPGCIFNTGKK